MGAYIFYVLKDCRREMNVQGDCYVDCYLNVVQVMGEEIFFQRERGPFVGAEGKGGGKR